VIVARHPPVLRDAVVFDGGLEHHAVGQLIDLYQRTTVYAGLLYGINPLDQPAVETGKRLAVRHLQSA